MKILNKRNLPNGRVPHNAVYVGRPTIFGNPYEMKSEKDRDRVCDLYEIHARKMMNSVWFVEELKKLKGKDLVCWCYPKRCHAETLIKLCEEV